MTLFLSDESKLKLYNFSGVCTRESNSYCILQKVDIFKLKFAKLESVIFLKKMFLGSKSKSKTTFLKYTFYFEIH